MTGSRPSRGYLIAMALLYLLLAGAIALFVYGSMTNSLQRPAPRNLSLRTVQTHG